MEAGKHMREKRKVNWKIRLLLSILGGTLLVIVLLFGITYGYFVNKLTVNNEKIVQMTFKEAERDLKEMMETGANQLNIFYNDSLAWKFSTDQYVNAVEKSIVIRKIVGKFDEMIVFNTDAYGFAIFNGDGRTVVSTAERKSQTGITVLSDSMKKFMKESKENYPYVSWKAGNEIQIFQRSPLYHLINRPVLLGIKSLEEDDDYMKDSYLLIALDEESVQKSYGQAGYNGSESVLVNEDNEIISATDEGMLGQIYEQEDEYQNITYDISYKGWKLVNMIPKATYLRETKSLRNFGIVLAILALLGGSLVAVHWSKKYTNPIQILMEQMESVGREQLDIVKPEKAGLPELDHLNEEFYYTVQKLKDYIRKLQEVEQEKAREELLALQYQINPHFLYNSLNSIRWMALMTNNTKVADSLVTLSKVIMPILRNPDFTWELKNELEFLKNYMDMMEIRYGNSMDYQLECEENLEEEIIPRFILQPVIENCFVHGGSNTEIRKIFLRIKKRDKFYIEVQNTGVHLSEGKLDEITQGMHMQEKTGNHIGLSNVYKRIKFLYEETGDVSITSDETGVFVHITF